MTQTQPRFAIYRILGNALPPRHAAGNTLGVVRHILDHEPRFPDSRRVWVLNRLAQEGERAALLALFAARGEAWMDLPFDPGGHFEAFLDISGIPFQHRREVGLAPGAEIGDELVLEWAIRHKSQQLVNINAARNAALAEGRATAEWTLVLDGGVMFEEQGWADFVAAVDAHPKGLIAVIAMTRLYSLEGPPTRLEKARQWIDRAYGTAGRTQQVLRRTARGLVETRLSPRAVMHKARRLRSMVGRIQLAATEEPQLAFHRQSAAIFDPRLRYGHRNKAELLARLGVNGPWRHWHAAPWDQEVPLPAEDRGQFFHAGHVQRLPAISAGKDRSAPRYRNRFLGVLHLAFEVDLRQAESRLGETMAAEPRGAPAPVEARALAERHAAEPLRLISDKPKPGPSGDPQDYFTLAPYVAADGRHLDGMPQHGSGESAGDWARFDRRSLQMAMSRIYVLTRCGRRLKDEALLAGASQGLRAWLLDPGSRMNPAARFAQLHPGRAEVNYIGLIEMRELAYLTEAVPILLEEGAISAGERDQVQDWLRLFRASCSETGSLDRALAHDNNIGTWTAASIAAIDLFLGDRRTAFEQVWRAPLRLGRQLMPLSLQPHEAQRTRPLHYCLFNLSGWWWMGRLAKRFGVDLMAYQGIAGESLAQALQLCAANRVQFRDYAAAGPAHDRWIAQLSMLFGLEEWSGPLLSPFSVDWGLPPVAFPEDRLTGAR